MIARGSGGAIVNVSSQASMIALKDHTLYCKKLFFFLLKLRAFVIGVTVKILFLLSMI